MFGRVCDFESLHIPIERSEHMSWNSAEFRDRRIVRMNPDPHARLLSHRRDLADEVRVVLPQFLF